MITKLKNLTFRANAKRKVLVLSNSLKGKISITKPSKLPN